eukprot:TRINITY_DN29207_c0_g1_i1.p1 TRINITY_DN29207_c0_g1~~TRINITY_DN29207_c0_g1_i1.p1  ORF type:complete len:945 (+),score=159.89 TRINITY_DN29207_c0_g1_i1:95-2929(+)
MEGAPLQSYCIIHPKTEFNDPKFQFDSTRVKIEVPTSDSSGDPYLEDTEMGSGTAEEDIITFDHVFRAGTSQERIFQELARPHVLAALESSRDAIFIASGATGSGKTFAVTGGAKDFTDRGLIPRSVSALFEALSARPDRESIVVSVSFYELYKDAVIDLLSEKRRKVPVKAGEKGPMLVGLLRQVVATESDAYHLLFQGDSNRHFQSFPQNPETSTGHVFYLLHINRTDTGKRTTVAFVDLAAPIGVRNPANTAIAQSLDALKATLLALRDGREPYWQSSILPQLLEPWLRPAGETQAHVCLINPVRYSYDAHQETHEWLAFARLAQEAYSGSPLDHSPSSLRSAWPARGGERGWEDRHTGASSAEASRTTPSSLAGKLPLWGVAGVSPSEASADLAAAAAEVAWSHQKEENAVAEAACDKTPVPEPREAISSEAISSVLSAAPEQLTSSFRNAQDCPQGPPATWISSSGDAGKAEVLGSSDETSELANWPASATPPRSVGVPAQASDIIVTPDGNSKAQPVSVPAAVPSIQALIQKGCATPPPGPAVAAAGASRAQVPLQQKTTQPQTRSLGQVANTPASEATSVARASSPTRDNSPPRDASRSMSPPRRLMVTGPAFMPLRSQGSSSSIKAPAAQACVCGNVFAPDASYCRFCGRKRYEGPGSSDTTQLPPRSTSPQRPSLLAVQHQQKELQQLQQTLSGPTLQSPPLASLGPRLAMQQQVISRSVSPLPQVRPQVAAPRAVSPQPFQQVYGQRFQSRSPSPQPQVVRIQASGLPMRSTSPLPNQVPLAPGYAPAPAALPLRPVVAGSGYFSPAAFGGPPLGRGSFGVPGSPQVGNVSPARGGFIVGSVAGGTSGSSVAMPRVQQAPQAIALGAAALGQRIAPPAERAGVSKSSPGESQAGGSGTAPTPLTPPARPQLPSGAMERVVVRGGAGSKSNDQAD